jgi:hypothetical protein
MKTEEIVERMERAWHNCRWSDIEALLADIAANPERAAMAQVGELIISALKAVTP